MRSPSSQVALDRARPSFKNKLINGDFAIAQRGYHFNITKEDKYGLDRWICTSGDKASNVAFRNRKYVTSYAPHDFIYLQTSSGPGVNYGISQRIEDFYLLHNKTVTLSFICSLSPGNKGIDIQHGLDGVIKTIVIDKQPPADSAWHKVSVTFDIGSTASGSKYYHVGIRSKGGGNAYFAKVQLEYGSVATAFEERSPALELLLCQRYYEKVLLIAFYTQEESPVYRSAVYQYNAHKRAHPALSIGDEENCSYINTHTYKSYTLFLTNATLSYARAAVEDVEFDAEL